MPGPLGKAGALGGSSLRSPSSYCLAQLSSCLMVTGQTHVSQKWESFLELSA